MRFMHFRHLAEMSPKTLKSLHKLPQHVLYITTYIVRTYAMLTYAHPTHVRTCGVKNFRETEKNFT